MIFVFASDVDGGDPDEFPEDDSAGSFTEESDDSEE